jgi:hypothetical protein
MPNFLERYLEGQHAQVWDELVALGDQVREKPVFGDAKAVAEETMRRVRGNAEILLPRLAAKGYQFADRSLEEKLSHANRVLSNIEAAKGKRDFQLASKRDEKAKLEVELERLRTRPPLENPGVYCPPEEGTVGQDEQTEEIFTAITLRLYGKRRVSGPLPISLEAWYRQVGYISLVGSHEVLNPPGNAVADPLFVASLTDFHTSLCYANPGDKRRVTLSRDDRGKAGLPKTTPAGVSAPEYMASIPNLAADFPFENEWRCTSFVNYLRKAFEWGGFPGWERDANPPRAAIAELTEGLLPI